jgi:hypothetical protein
MPVAADEDRHARPLSDAHSAANPTIRVFIGSEAIVIDAVERQGGIDARVEGVQLPRNAT